MKTTTETRSTYVRPDYKKRQLVKARQSEVIVLTSGETAKGMRDFFTGTIVHSNMANHVGMVSTELGCEAYEVYCGKVNITSENYED